MKEFTESLRGLGEEIWDLRKGLFMLLIILFLSGTAYYFDDFVGTSRLSIVLTIVGYVVVAFFNVHLVPYIAYKESWKWNFLMIAIPSCGAGFCIVSFWYTYFSMSLFIVGGFITFIRLVTYKSPIPLGNRRR